MSEIVGIDDWLYRAVREGALRERAAVVAYLRAEAPARLLPEVQRSLAAYAELIDQGEHLRHLVDTREALRRSVDGAAGETTP